MGPSYGKEENGGQITWNFRKIGKTVGQKQKIIKQERNEHHLFVCLILFLLVVKFYSILNLPKCKKVLPFTE
jgi:hypothetical protein